MGALPWGTLGKLREHWGMMGISRLPIPLGPPLLKDILIRGYGSGFRGFWTLVFLELRAFSVQACSFLKLLKVRGFSGSGFLDFRV